MALTQRQSEIKGSAVEFYISKTLEEAQEFTSHHGAVCFVTDNDNSNYIVLNGEIYGGVTSLELDKIPVTRDLNDKITSTLADYFYNGILRTQTFQIVKEDVDNNNETYLNVLITANENGIYLGSTTDGNQVLSKTQIESLISAAETKINSDILQTLNTFTTTINLKISGVYKVKGTKETKAALDLDSNKNNTEVGDVWNIKLETRVYTKSGESNKYSVGENESGWTLSEVYPPGTNFVCTEINETQSGVEIIWDALGGTVSFENYYTKTEVDDKNTATLTSAKNYTDERINAITAGVDDLGELATQVKTNTTNITTLNTRLTWQ